MRKKTHSSFRQNLFISIIICMSSCVNDIGDTPEPESVPEQYPVNLSTKIAKSTTRVTETNFENGDAIGLFILNQPNELDGFRHVDNMRFYYSLKDGFIPDKTIFFSDENVKADFISYYPYQPNAVKNEESCIVVETHSNQEEKDKFSLSDFLVATKKNVKPSSDPVNITFHHKMSRIDIILKPFDGQTADDLLALNPTVRIKGVNIKANYDFLSDTFRDHNTPDDVYPYGTWFIEDNELIGKYALLIPQTLESQNNFIEFSINNKNYVYKATPNIVLTNGRVNRLTFSFEEKSDAVACSVNSQIQEWTDIHESDQIATEVSSYIDISNLSFANSDVYSVFNNGVKKAEIVKEYLLSDNISSQAIVAYPVIDGDTDLNNGIVLKIIGQSSNKHGGKIKWNTFDNTFNYTQGSSAAANLLYISENGEISTTRPEHSIQLQIEPEILTDKRDDETISYPIVKIGTQYWMKGNLKATKYNDGKNIILGKDFKNNSAHYCKTENYYFYNAACIETGKLNPEGWRIGNESDWQTLREYLKNDASLMKNGTAWKKDPQNTSKVTGSSGFNSVATGYFSSTYGGNGQYASYWSTEVVYPNTAYKMVFLSYNNNEIKERDYKEEYGLSVRCIKE